MSQNNWFAFHTFRNGKKSFLKRLEDENIERYIPMKAIRTLATNYDQAVTYEAIFPSLIFIKTDITTVRKLRQDFFSLASPYTEPGNSSAPAVIPDKEMEIFRFVLEKGCERLDAIDPVDQELCKGDKVQVLDGVFKGAEGYIVRIKGTRRLVVSINGVAAVATAYIPKEMLQKVEQEDL